MPEIVSFIEKARASGLDITANTYAYTAWNNSLSAFVPPWAHDGGNAKLIERLRDPKLRERIKKEMDTPATDWDNEWSEIPGAEAILVSEVQSEKLASRAGQDHLRDRENVERRSQGRDLRFTDSGRCFHLRLRLRHAAVRCFSGAEAAVGFD